jgi:glutathione S-transferase
LKEKALPFETKVLDAAKGDTRTADYLAATVTGRVPTLVHGGFGLGESTAIVEYLDEAFPERRVMPTAVQDRARCRQLMSWMRSDDTAAIREERGAITMFYESQRAKAPLSDAAKGQAEKLFGVALRVLRGRPNVFDAWSIVDAELTFLLHRLIRSGEAVPDAIRAYAEAQWKRDTVQAYVGLSRPPV